ncbi:MAG TPA: sugar ABC transporter substrate-binding protein [Verrucomicrobiales bacterium]|nr:sugar ABC transporter substrate-binding protein [Verrucomicrobiales bacterium]
MLLCLTACNPSTPSQTAPGGGSQAEGTKPAKKPRVAFISNGVAAFWTIAETGVGHAAAKLGVEASVHMPAGIEDQKRTIEDLLTRGVDGIAVSPIDPANQTEILNKAAANTRLLTHDSDAPDSNRLLYIGMDNYKAGRMCGALVKEALPKGGKVMLFIGRLEQDNARRRRQGVIDEMLGRSEDPKRYDPPGDVITGNGFTILGTLTDQFDRAKGKANAEDSMARYPDLDAMVGLFGYNPPLLIEALDRAGKLGKIKLIAFDEADETLDGIQKGNVYGTVVQNPYLYGYKSVEILTELTRGNKGVVPEGKFIDIPARQIRKANVDEFWADLKAKLKKG